GSGARGDDVPDRRHLLLAGRPPGRRPGGVRLDDRGVGARGRWRPAMVTVTGAAVARRRPRPPVRGRNALRGPRGGSRLRLAGAPRRSRERGPDAGAGGPGRDRAAGPGPPARGPRLAVHARHRGGVAPSRGPDRTTGDSVPGVADALGRGRVLAVGSVAPALDRGGGPAGCA